MIEGERLKALIEQNLECESGLITIDIVDEKFHDFSQKSELKLVKNRSGAEMQ